MILAGAAIVAGVAVLEVLRETVAPSLKMAPWAFSLFLASLLATLAHGLWYVRRLRPDENEDSACQKPHEKIHEAPTPP